jgi:hypothetical protein
VDIMILSNRQPVAILDNAREEKMKPEFSHNIITTPIPIRLIRGIELAESQLLLVLSVN